MDREEVYKYFESRKELYKLCQEYIKRKYRVDDLYFDIYDILLTDGGLLNIYFRTEVSKNCVETVDIKIVTGEKDV